MLESDKNEQKREILKKVIFKMKARFLCACVAILVANSQKLPFELIGK